MSVAARATSAKGFGSSVNGARLAAVGRSETMRSSILWVAWMTALIGSGACSNDEGLPPVDGGSDASMIDASTTDASTPDATIDPPCSGPPGLYEAGSCTRLAEGVRAYHPLYQLWADDSGKERYLYLPEGSTIDTSDPDAWVFPVGTKFWKTFAVGSLRIETRVLEKTVDDVGPGAWTMRVYMWNTSQDAVSEVLDGVDNALGTTHDIPAPVLCERCHQGVRDVGLGVAALQLNHAEDGVTLAALASEGRLSSPIALADAVVPGDDSARAALGYLHANCSHCHGGEAPAADLNMHLLVGTEAVADTYTYMTSVGVPSGWASEGVTARIVPGHPEASAVTARMALRGDGQMPPIATEEVDIVALQSVRDWISSLP